MIRSESFHDHLPPLTVVQGCTFPNAVAAPLVYLQLQTGARYSLSKLTKDLLLLRMDIAKWTRTDIQEEHGIPGPDLLIRRQNLFSTLNLMIPWLIGPACV